MPGRLNLALLCLGIGVCSGLLWAASRAATPWALAACALAFSYAGNTLFALLHEAVHGILHPNPAVNEWGGRIAAAFFPTGLRVQRAYHLAHHRNNRGPQERFDYLQPGESVWLKRAQWYSILTGFYWVLAVAGLLLYLVLPAALRNPAFREPSSQLATQTGARAYLGMLDDIDPVMARMEIVFSLGIQGLLVAALDLTAAGWIACYLAFALHWSTLQYADHAFSPLDVREGAWNLRTYALARLCFLNYHFHLAHHRHPSVPWLYLPRLVEPGDARPRYWRIWLSMWAGPRPLPDGAS